MERRLLKPLMNVCKEFPEDKRAIEVIGFLVNCTKALINIKAVALTYYSAFDDLSTQLLARKDELNSAILFFFPDS